MLLAIVGSSKPLASSAPWKSGSERFFANRHEIDQSNHSVVWILVFYITDELMLTPIPTLEILPGD